MVDPHENRCKLIYSAVQIDEPHRHNRNPVGAIRLLAPTVANRPYCSESPLL
ncbi:MAG: hypothetical protein F6K40_01690 [Okeania sp. SIO3I5]|uniref:hypothetical protein n=1 Tax=Okeania sp. SIO3I5 TaxID=2607805 RepID=UPI0013B678E3|nr:hypothetical protein [Okeania sp. SIO3I5]NEQ35088.1 hypothetical protein [Okeania sp. SIO3I5]